MIDQSPDDTRLAVAYGSEELVAYGMHLLAKLVSQGRRIPLELLPQFLTHGRHVSPELFAHGLHFLTQFVTHGVQLFPRGEFAGVPYLGNEATNASQQYHDTNADDGYQFGAQCDFHITAFPPSGC